MDVIRAPWRMDYIDQSNRSHDEPECIFCRYPKESEDRENLVLHRGELCFVILNRYPYSNGHLMVVPYRHTSYFPSLTPPESGELVALAQDATRLLSHIMSPDGFNLGMNIGKVAGAGIGCHLHLHVVPRWNGDVNFMSVTAETKVLPEALCVTWEKLTDAWKNI